MQGGSVARNLDGVVHSDMERLRPFIRDPKPVECARGLVAGGIASRSRLPLYVVHTLEDLCAMANILNRLRALDAPIRVGIVGIGNIGRGLVLQCDTTPGMRTVAVADRLLDRAIACAEWRGREYEVVETVSSMHRAIERGRLAVTDDGTLIARSGLVDVHLDASSAIEPSGRFAAIALEHRKHVVMMNGEADLTFGPWLLGIARQNDVVYTAADGDQPAVIKRLIDDVDLWGFDLVMAGNMKGYLDRTINPTTMIPEANKRKLDYVMCTSYTDGTKLAIEMAVVANAIGARVSVPGMAGPRMNHVLEVFDHFDFASNWTPGRPVVDYILGAQPSGGVFVVAYTDDPHQQETLAWYPCDNGPGPFYVFHRPYHLGHIEAIQCIVEACLDHRSILEPVAGYLTNVYAYAKRDLRPGDRLDGIGGYTVYGLIENCADDERNPGVPIALCDGMTVLEDVPKDHKVSASAVQREPGNPGWAMFERAASSSSEIYGEIGRG